MLDHTNTDLTLLLAALIVLCAVRHFLVNNDEVPVAIAGLGFLSLVRGCLIDRGIVRAANFDYGIGRITRGDLHFAGFCILIGTAVTTLGYIFFYDRKARPAADTPQLWLSFLSNQRSVFWAGLIFYYVTNEVATYITYSNFQQTGQLSNSYAVLFSLGGSSAIIGAIVFVKTVYQRSGIKFILYAVIAMLCMFSISFGMRFRVLAWAMIAIFLFADRFKPLTRGTLYIVAFMAFGVVFSLLGVLRHDQVREKDWEGRMAFATKSFTSLGDMNFVDGFAMLSKVYPSQLSYSLGGEHLEVLLRPIPRSLWPGKPVGSWHQKLAQKRGGRLYGTGISPSLYGSFYAEGGIVGVGLLSALYGYVLAYLARRISEFQSILRVVLKGMLISAIFAIIRGGDLAGAFAFVGMSYWPIAILLWWYSRYVRQNRGGAFSGRSPQYVRLGYVGERPRF